MKRTSTRRRRSGLRKKSLPQTISAAGHDDGGRRTAFEGRTSRGISTVPIGAVESGNAPSPLHAHIPTMAAAQPFISGAISKTISMPADATLEDVKAAYLLAWKSMVKAVALYRDGSKLSQPLRWKGCGDNTGVMELAEESPTERVLVRYLAKRRPWPSRRSGYTQKAICWGR